MWTKATILRATVVVSGALAVACGGEAPPVEPAEPATEAASGTIPITTRSDEAYDLYLEGRDLAEHIRPAEARQRYLAALELDRHFALAHLALANSAVSTREFFESMERALALADVVSEGERLMILAVDAGVRGEPDEQLRHLHRLVELYPEDPRALAALAGVYFGRQEFAEAVEYYERAVERAPDYSPPYNLLGYAYRSLGRYEEAEDAFLRYIELVPGEPNPYDSYAELLMKVGRFEESIAAYEKALEIKPDFLFSLRGIGHNLVFLGRFDEAREVFERQLELAPDVGQRRGALFWLATAHIHQDEPAAALEVLTRMSALADADGDRAAVAGDLVTMGNVLLEAGDPEAAEERFVEAVQLMGDADVPEEVKENTRRNFLYWKARIETERGRYADAERHLAAYREQVARRQIPFEERRVHELAGAIALGRGDVRTAIEELAAANQQNPRVLYLSARAHLAADDLARATELAERAANFNGFGLNYAFVRRPAQQLLAELRAQGAAATT